MCAELLQDEIIHEYGVYRIDFADRTRYVGVSEPGRSILDAVDHVCGTGINSLWPLRLRTRERVTCIGSSPDHDEANRLVNNATAGLRALALDDDPESILGLLTDRDRIVEPLGDGRANVLDGNLVVRRGNLAFHRAYEIARVGVGAGERQGHLLFRNQDGTIEPYRW